MSDNLNCLNCKKPKNKCLPCVPCSELPMENTDKHHVQQEKSNGKHCSCTENKPCCENDNQTGHNNMANRIDVRSCVKVPPPHPCDPPIPCNNLKSEEQDCIRHLPTICIEKLKNPALPGEITRCKPGNFLNARTCKRIEPPHPCDPLPLCSTLKPRKRPCNMPFLCLQRVKNPDERFILDPCVNE